MKKTKRCQSKIESSEVLALKQLRVDQGLTLKLAGEEVGLSAKALGAIENGRVSLSDERIRKIVRAYGKSYPDLIFAKRVIEKESKKRKKREVVRTVLSNKDRRSYQRIITKESRALQSLRKMKGISLCFDLGRC